MFSVKKIKQASLQSALISFSALAVLGCTGQSNPPAVLSGATANVEARVFVGNANGKVSVIEHGPAGSRLAAPIDLFSSDGDIISSTRNHIFVNMGSANQTAALDPVGTATAFKKFIAVGQRPVHIYREAPDGTRIWVLNDGDATTGIDTITPACSAAQVASVTVIQNHGEGGDDTVSAGDALATICVGKGHHKATFSYPTEANPSIPLRAFVSNIKDGTITVIDNDPASANYLKVIGTIDLCNTIGEAAQGKLACDADPATPNNAGPHGMVFSPVSGKVYNNNESYGTEDVIDPATLAVEATLPIGFAGAGYLTSDGRFVFVRGTDTADPNHVVGKLTVINVADNSFTTTDLPDIHLGDLAFTSDGTKLYIPSAATGSATQKTNEKSNLVVVFDVSALPALTKTKEITVGATAAGRTIGLHETNGKAEHLFATNRADGTVSVIDAETESVVDTLQVGGTPTSLLVFSMEGDLSHSH